MTEPWSPPRLAPSSGVFTYPLTQNMDVPGPSADLETAAWIGIGVLVVIVDCHRNFILGVVTVIVIVTFEERWGTLY